MKRLTNVGRVLSKSEQRLLFGGLQGEGKCYSTCWYQSEGGDECNSIEVPDCENHTGDCQTGDCSDVPKSTCSCDGGVGVE